MTLRRDVQALASAILSMNAVLDKGYPEFNPDQPRDSYGRWGHMGIMPVAAVLGRSGRRDQEARRNLRRYKNVDPELTAKELMRNRKALLGDIYAMQRNNMSSRAGATWTGRAGARQYSDEVIDEAMRLYDFMGRIDANAVRRWVGKLEAELQGDNFEAVFERLKRSKMSNETVMQIARGFYGGKAWPRTRTAALRNIHARWDKLQDFVRASRSIDRAR